MKEEEQQQPGTAPGTTALSPERALHLLQFQRYTEYPITQANEDRCKNVLLNALAKLTRPAVCMVTVWVNESNDFSVSDVVERIYKRFRDGRIGDKVKRKRMQPVVHWCREYKPYVREGMQAGHYHMLIAFNEGDTRVQYIKQLFTELEVQGKLIKSVPGLKSFKISDCKQSPEPKFWQIGTEWGLCGCFQHFAYAFKNDDQKPETKPDKKRGHGGSQLKALYVSPGPDAVWTSPVSAPRIPSEFRDKPWEWEKMKRKGLDKDYVEPTVPDEFQNEPWVWEWMVRTGKDKDYIPPVDPA